MINIRRSNNHKMVAGVLAGISEHFGWGLLPLRLITVLFGFWGPGLFIYLVLWMMMDEPKD